MSCRLYLIVTPMPDDGGQAALRDVLAGGDVASVLLASGPDGSLDRDAASRLMAVAQAHDVAVLVERDYRAAAAIGADGVHIAADPKAYQAARQALGDEAIIGAGCGISKHDAMLLAEMGADYIAFRATALDLLSWWAELFEVPIVAWAPDCQDEAVASARRGADFIALTPALWAEAPAETISHLTRLLEGARDAA